MSGTVSFQIGYLQPKNLSAKVEAIQHLQKVHDSVLERSSHAAGSAAVLGVPAVCTER